MAGAARLLLTALVACLLVAANCISTPYGACVATYLASACVFQPFRKACQQHLMSATAIEPRDVMLINSWCAA
jgi:hypothetical protein